MRNPACGADTHIDTHTHARAKNTTHWLLRKAWSLRLQSETQTMDHSPHVRTLTHAPMTPSLTRDSACGTQAAGQTHKQTP